MICHKIKNNIKKLFNAKIEWPGLFICYKDHLKSCTESRLHYRVTPSRLKGDTSLTEDFNDITAGIWPRIVMKRKSI